jgi:iron complex outermembrane receptor protein
MPRHLPVLCLGVLALATPLRAQTEARLAEGPSQLTHLSIEELARVKVVSLTGRPETASEAAGAISVITAEQIRLMGATTLPDALRLTPGLQASRIDADEWALALRGFASRLSRSMLVLVDGRSVWTPLFAGVFWDAQDLVLEDVDQIEVRRGPGGAVFGANALNGVISVRTKDAKDTLGGLAVAGAGSAGRTAVLRYGARAGQDAYYRVFAKHAVHDGTAPLTAAGYDDEWTTNRGGFRLDWDARPGDRLTLSGDLYRGHSGQPVTVATFTPPFSVRLAGDASFRGGDLLGRWTRALSGGGEVAVQSYYDRAVRHEPHYAETRDTVDLEVRHRFHWGGRHDSIWGADYRASRGRFEGVPTVQILPAMRTDDIAGVFANDEVRLAGDRLRVTLGTKLEWNDYSGWNVQPSARAAWLAGVHNVWGAVTRGVRTSSRAERDLVFYSSLSAVEPRFARTVGTREFEPESVLAVEGGYKTRFARVIFSVTAFRNAYRDLAANETGPPAAEAGRPPEPDRVVIPVRITNGAEGRVSGVEAAGLVSAARWLRLRASYSFLSLRLDEPPGGFRANTPRHQAWLAAYAAPRSDLDLALVFRAVGGLPDRGVPSFRDLDARLAWRPRPHVELAAVGANLLAARHVEFAGGFAVERSGRLEASLRF